MQEDVNETIIEMIEKSNYEESVKKFLIESLRQEFFHSGGRWSYTDIYDKNIRKFCKDYKGKS